MLNQTWAKLCRYRVVAWALRMYAWRQVDYWAQLAADRALGAAAAAADAEEYRTKAIVAARLLAQIEEATAEHEAQWRME